MTTTTIMKYDKIKKHNIAYEKINFTKMTYEKIKSQIHIKMTELKLEMNIFIAIRKFVNITKLN